MVSNDENNTVLHPVYPETMVSVGSRSLRIGSRSFPLSRVVLCLGLLDTVLIITAAVIGVYCGTASEVSAPDQTAQILLIEFKTLQDMQTEVIQSHEEARQALKEELRKNKELKLLVELNQSSCDQLQTQIESLQVEKATLQSHISDIEGSCGRCLSGWQLINSTCYFHSVSETGAFKTWQDSRVDCISRGGNLTVINTWEKQLNLYEFLLEKDQSLQLGEQRGAWIDLKYNQAEQSLAWLNRVTLHGPRYWNVESLNNQNEGAESCAAILNTRTPERTWFHANCHLEKEWICEMEPY